MNVRSSSHSTVSARRPYIENGFVARALHQRIVDEVAEFGIQHAARRCAHALQYEGIETVECADHAVGDLATLLDGGIDVGKVFEVCGQRQAGHAWRYREQVRPALPSRR